MKSKLTLSLLAVGAALFAGCNGPTVTPTPSPSTAYFIDVHEFGPGKVRAADVAKAHQADLAAESKHGVRFIDYWVDESRGLVYCLSEAKDAPSIVATHREAHGLLPSKIMPVTSGQAAAATKGAKLFLDVHDLGPGNVTAAAVAAAHEKDLAVESEFGVRFLNYWVDEVNGKVICLSEAPSADAVRATHQRAHGLMPVSVDMVTNSAQ